MMIAHRIALDPNNVQATYFARAAGTARFAYNWGLAEWKRQYEAWKEDNSLEKPSAFALSRQLNAIKREQFPWMLEVTKSAPGSALLQLGRAFNNFFAGRARYPKFRKKGVHERFTIGNTLFRVEGARIRIPKLGWVRMRESLRFKGKIMSATVSRVADRWFVSITVDIGNDSHLTSAENQGSVGVDLGVKALATLSTGEVFEGPKAHKAELDRLRRRSRWLSRKVKGSANRRKEKMRVAKLHARIAHVRQDAPHKITTDLTRRFHTIAIEDLNVSGMVKNRHLSRAVSDMGFFEFRRQLEYKAAMRGGRIVVVDRFYPSSKTCSSCGHKLDELPLSVRDWTCPGCDTDHDRDVNAAINLRDFVETTEGSSGSNACGEEGSGPGARGSGETGLCEAGSQHV